MQILRNPEVDHFTIGLPSHAMRMRKQKTTLRSMSYGATHSTLPNSKNTQEDDQLGSLSQYPLPNGTKQHIEHYQTSTFFNIG